MKYPKLIECLKLFSQESLRQHLGEDIIEQLLLEWGNNGPLTKKRLAEMILQLNGIEILRNPAFRKDVLLHMDANDIEAIFHLLPSSRKAGIFELAEKATAIANHPWGASDANRKLLDILGIDQAILSPQQEDDIAVVTHQAGNRFYELLDYQFIIKQRVLTELHKPYPLKRMLIHMPTGTGKTKTAMHTIVQYYNFTLKKQGAIIWLAHTTELLQQAYETFASTWEHLGEGQINTYKLWGRKNLSIPQNGFEGILFCGIQKLQMVKQNQPELFAQIVKDARLVVFDEAHKAAATETKQLVESFMLLPPSYADRSLVGLTATPGRTTLSSDENKVLSNLFENRLIGVDVDMINQLNMSEIAYLNHSSDTNAMHYFQNAGILAKLKKEQLTYAEKFTDTQLQQIKTHVTNNGYVDFNKKALQIVGQNRSRNKAILDKLKELSAAQIPTIVFACSVTHAKLLSFMLSLEDIPNGLVLGDMNTVDRAETIAAFKNRENSLNILINYEVLTTGFDSTNIQCVFITRPTQSIVLYSQMLGRGLRGPMMGGNKECLLIDIKDNLGRYDADMAFKHFDAYWS